MRPSRRRLLEEGRRHRLDRQPAGRASRRADSRARRRQPPGPSESAAPKKVEITEDLVVKYVVYQKENLALVAKYAEDTRKNMDAAKGDTANWCSRCSIAERMGKELDAQQHAKRRAARPLRGGVQDAAGRGADGGHQPRDV